MKEKEYGDTFLLAPFREFYREVIRLKHMVVSGAWVAPSSKVSTEGGELKTDTGTWVYFPNVIQGAEIGEEHEIGRRGWIGPASGVAPRAASSHKGNGSSFAAPSPSSEAGNQLAPSDEIKVSTFVWQHLVSLFERQEAYAWRYGGTYGAEFYKEAQYVMVALADEIFLNTEWEGRRFWVLNLLESKIFHTHVAGEAFFQRLEKLLVDRDPVYRDLAAVYLMALSLGFRGKFRGKDDRGQLEAYRHRLFRFVFRREPELENDTRKVFPETYYHTLRDETKRRLPNPRAWLILLGAVIVAYITLTHGIWVKLTGPLFEKNGNIKQVVKEMENRR
jgi:type VI secretion system protein ImpK